MNTYYLVRSPFGGLSNEFPFTGVRFYVCKTREEADTRAGIYPIIANTPKEALEVLADLLGVPRARVERVEDERPTD